MGGCLAATLPQSDFEPQFVDNDDGDGEDGIALTYSLMNNQLWQFWRIKTYQRPVHMDKPDLLVAWRQAA